MQNIDTAMDRWYSSRRELNWRILWEGSLKQEVYAGKRVLRARPASTPEPGSLTIHQSKP